MSTTGDGRNDEQAKYWTEQGGPSWVRDEVIYDLMLAPFNDALIAHLDPQPGERFLDVGCGFGTTALAIAERGATVHGVDISPPMIERAEVRAAAVRARADFAVGDAQEDPLGGPYDAVASRFGVMFFADPVRAFRNMSTATRPGGRLGFVCWQPLDHNPWMNVAANVLRDLLRDPPAPPPATAGPFAFGDTAYVHRVLAAAGWRDIAHAPVEASIRMGGLDGVTGAVDHVLTSSVARGLLALGDDALRDRAAAILHDRFSAIAVDGVVHFPAAVWLVSATR